MLYVTFRHKRSFFRNAAEKNHSLLADNPASKVDDQAVKPSGDNQDNKDTVSVVANNIAATKDGTCHHAMIMPVILHHTSDASTVGNICDD